MRKTSRRRSAPTTRSFASALLNFFRPDPVKSEEIKGTLQKARAELERTSESLKQSDKTLSKAQEALDMAAAANRSIN